MRKLILLILVLSLLAMTAFVFLLSLISPEAGIAAVTILVGIAIIAARQFVVERLILVSTARSRDPPHRQLKRSAGFDNSELKHSPMQTSGPAFAPT